MERAEALLRTVFPGAEISKVLASELATQDSGGQSTGPDQSLSSKPLNSPSLAQQAGSDVSQDYIPLASPTQPAADDQSLLHESAPSAADDDFEWDEREALWSSHDPGAGMASLRGADESVLPKITDGMATLSTNDSNTGFLGSVSGAALLRLISDHRGGIKSGGDTTPRGEERRGSGEAFLALRPGEQSGPWLRAQPVLTRAFVDTLVDAYFAHYHPTFPILHEATFREQYQTLSDRPKGTWHVLANLVAALGSFVSSTCSDDTDINLFNAVKSQLTIEALEAGSLGLVQAFAMAANYLQKRNRPNSGYTYGGVALRLAISLGLHKEFHGWQTAPLKKEIRRRVWWSLCVLDVGATVTYGRPLNWPTVGVEAAFPLNIHEQVRSISLPLVMEPTDIVNYRISKQSQQMSHSSVTKLQSTATSGPNQHITSRLFAYTIA